MYYSVLQFTIRYKPYTTHYTVSVLGREEGYTVKYTPCLKEFPRAKPEGTPEGKGIYLTVYPELSPNSDGVSFYQS